MSSPDVAALQQQIADLKRQVGMVDEHLDVSQPPPFSRSELAELVKFEQFPSPITVLAGKPPGNAREKMSDNQKRWPRMVYLARQGQNGKWVTSLERPEQWQFAIQGSYDRAREAYEKFAESCQRIVSTEREYEAALREGWRDSAQAALEFREQQFKEQGEIAAHRNYEDRNMGEQAKAESAAAEAEHFGHLPAIPEKRKYTRKPKPDAE